MAYGNQRLPNPQELPNYHYTKLNPSRFLRLRPSSSRYNLLLIPILHVDIPFLIKCSQDLKPNSMVHGIRRFNATSTRASYTPTTSILYFSISLVTELGTSNIPSTKSHVHLFYLCFLPRSFQIISRVSRPCVMFLNKYFLQCEVVSLTPNPQAGVTPDRLLIQFAANLHIWRYTTPSQPEGTRHVVVTRTHEWTDLIYH